MHMKVAALILAAGRSSRLGRPKQLVPFAGRTLVRHAALTAIYTPCVSVHVVVGAFQNSVVRELEGVDVGIVRNRFWERGMGTSIKVGVEEVLQLEDPDGILLMVCDQPHLNEAHLFSLLEKFDKPSQIIASQYGGTIGVPAIFGRDHFEPLLALGGEKGARSILETRLDQVIPVEFSGGEVDVDTLVDLRRLWKIKV